MSGNANKLGDAAGCPGKSFLFFLTCFGGWIGSCDLCARHSCPGISLAGDGAGDTAEHHDLFFVMSGALPAVHENPRA